eukprot:CAMPEP_0174891404 /NCGR_PEP_ID=MMETSP0167-20121228/6465_1 /TAXON_ID=38298 /ORGANISM="Rhodella maculata, Strain CCMP736" /LENGTH=60 /DNA_ID=CAMNT_0016129549 /DNA_START=243 /DNA_END=422 /DNA_ORIENTATION=+
MKVADAAGGICELMGGSGRGAEGFAATEYRFNVWAEFLLVRSVECVFRIDDELWLSGDAW